MPNDFDSNQQYIKATKSKSYKEIEANPNFPHIEKQILDLWRNNDTFQSSIKGRDEYVFYDGPPFANGLPHYGHLLTGYIKDLFARYQTMLGQKVERRFGWDCHGLPAEMGSEKELGISGKLEIEKYGIAKFNEHCRESVLRYKSEWRYYVERQARWVDFDNDYRTMDINYMESVLWAFKNLYDKGLIYQAMRVMPYSWACETPVSDFETRMDNAYREKQSKAVTVLFELDRDAIIAKINQNKLNTINLKQLATTTDRTDIHKDFCPENGQQAPDVAELSQVYAVAWTTTPWTLPSNLALAVGAEIEYAVLHKKDKYYIVAANLIAKYQVELGDEVVATIKGNELKNIAYKPLFSYFRNQQNAFKILLADFVTTEDGSGIVHMAPGFGEDDQKLCEEHKIPIICPVDSAGKFTAEVTDFEGMQVFEANDQIIIALKKQGNWLKTEQYTHNYPHCWRTDTPLIYKAIPSWYLQVTAIRERMVEHNEKINWIPGHIKDGLFGNWLKNARDWSISRNRYWGCPIPIWQSDDHRYPCIEVYGSIKELEQAFGVKVDDLHRPFIDSLTKPNPNDPTGKSMLRRVPEVLDCWFESGSMPFAQVHYPFENEEWFNSHFPADFIVEYVAQTRGWFYTLMVLGTALFDKAPFKNCICHGVILGDGGTKLSKRLQNYADPKDVFDQIGADAMRWFMISSQIMRGQEIVIDKNGSGMQESMRLVIKPLWNAYNFFTIYANIDGINADFDLNSKVLLDRYIIGKCVLMANTVKQHLDLYDVPSACKLIEEFLEVLNNWYIRRSRDRFWRQEIDDDKVSAYNTLYSVLRILCVVAAPLLPLITEAVFIGLQGKDSSSVHLESYHNFDEQFVDQTLLSAMERVRSACNAAHYIRNEAKIRVRQPLASVIFIGVANDSKMNYSNNADMQQLVMDEINVKSWCNIEQTKIQEYADLKLHLNLPLIGKRIPAKVKDIIAAAKIDQWSIEAEIVNIAGINLLPAEYSIKLAVKPEFIGYAAPLDTNDALVMLDLNITSELLEEGIVRDIVRMVQQTRKEAGFNVSDRIMLSIGCSDNTVVHSLVTWQDYIKIQVLAAEVQFETDIARVDAVVKSAEFKQITRKSVVLEWYNNVECLMQIEVITKAS